MGFFYHFVATLAIFLGLDMLWLNCIIDEKVVFPWVGHLGRVPNWSLAGIFYLVMALRLAYGGAFKSIVVDDAAPAFTDGASVGFQFSVVYAAVNVVFFRPAWSLDLIMLDIAWCTFAGAATAVASYAIGNGLAINETGIRRI